MIPISEVKQSFEQMPYFQFIGFEIERFEEDEVLLKLTIQDHLLNVNETLHGGVHAAMIDQVLSMCLRAKTKTRCATINLNINYLAPSNSGTIYAKGKIIQLGYRIATVEGEVFTKDGQILAKGIGTFKIIRD
ncbi:hypothetical protein MTP04_18920 [Lysinibacillus sp. PLM2]|nr:hypothetical protein MTP04_18920 [Lysinibacillus sp. PLM2]